MKIFLYEFVTGGGMYSVGQAWPPPDSLLCEGRAMLAALAADFAEIASVQITTLCDARCEPLRDPRIAEHRVASAAAEQDLFARFSSEADWSVVIAPEIGGALLERCAWVEAAGGRLLGSSTQTLQIASDKQRTAQWLSARAIPTPRGVLLQPCSPLPVDFSWPAVLKPCDGAGSLGVRYLEASADLNMLTTGAGRWRLETFCPGLAASVAVLCGPRGVFALPPARQTLAAGGSFAYLGGELPLPGPLATRASRSAAAIACLPQPLGYLGVDLVLGDDPSGQSDVVIEINPRLTTSYVGLRALASCNLAAAMLAIAAGEDAALCFHAGGVKFDTSGNVLADAIDLS